MNLLAIDSAASVLSVALASGEHTWNFEAAAGLRHSELIMDIVDILTKKAGIKPDDLDGVLCMGGPGSFTGLRIGFSVAKGLALSLNIPFVPIPSMDCIAAVYSCWPGLVVPVIDARTNAFFCALFYGGKRLCQDMDADPGQIAAAINSEKTGSEKVLLAGPDAEKLYNKLMDNGNFAGILDIAPRRGYALSLLDIAKNKEIFDNDNTVWHIKGPEYVRKSDAEINLHK